MLTTGFSVQGASLKLLRLHERSVIAWLNTSCDTTARKLRQLGLAPGQFITLEQRFPRFIIRVGNAHHALDETMINAIYVRDVED
jgi:ferrous iron transport protein A